MDRMVCTYFLLANIVVFGFGRKNKHVMPNVSKQKKMELKAEDTFNFIAFLEKLVMYLYIQWFKAQFLMDSDMFRKFSFGSYTFNLPNCSELKKSI